MLPFKRGLDASPNKPAPESDPDSAPEVPPLDLLTLSDRKPSLNESDISSFRDLESISRTSQRPHKEKQIHKKEK